MDYDYEPDLDEMSEVETKSILRFLDNSIVPAVLLTSEFDKDSRLGTEIVKAPWSVVFLTNSSNNDFYMSFKNYDREMIRRIDTNEIKDPDEIKPALESSTEMMLPQPLPIIRCVKDNDDNDPLNNIMYCFRNILMEIMKVRGAFALYLYDINEENDFYKGVRNELTNMEKDYPLVKNKIFLIGKAKNDIEKRWVERGFAKELDDSQPDFWVKQEVINRVIDNDLLYGFLSISNTRIPIKKRMVSRISIFSQLLTIENAEMMPQIRRSDIPLNFKMFLERSVCGIPSWHWYNPEVGYHLTRNVEKEILDALDLALDEASDNDDARPLLLIGPAYSGKTNILGAVAWKMYKKGSCPVIYIPNMISTINDAVDSLSLFLEDLEKQESRDLGSVVPALLVWDSSCQRTEDLNEPLDLLTKLRKRGRRVQMICSAYTCNKTFQDSFRNPFEVGQTLDASETRKLINIFCDKGGYTKEEMEELTNRIGNSPFFIAALYQLDEIHDIIQNIIQTHIGNEIEGSNRDLEEYIIELTKNKMEGVYCDFEKYIHELQKEKKIVAKKTDREIAKQIKRMIYCIALCSFYDFNYCGAPVTLVLRLLGLDFKDVDDLKWVFHHTMLRLRKYDGALFCGIRSHLESEIILDIAKKSYISNCRLAILHMLLEYLNLSNRIETDVLRKLIRDIGPNSKLSEKYKVWKNSRDNSRFQANNAAFREIWKKLGELREDQHNNILLPQESALIREYYKHSTNSPERLACLSKIYDTLKIALEKYNDRILRLNLLVERSNVFLLLYPWLPNVDFDAEYDSQRKELLPFGREGSRHAQATLLKLGLAYYRYIGDNIDKAQETLDELDEYCSFFEVKADDEVRELIDDVDTEYDRFKDNDERFEDRIKAGDSCALRVKVGKARRNILNSNNNEVDIQKEARNILNDYLQNHIDIVRKDSRLAAYKIEFLWMSSAGCPPYPPKPQPESPVKHTFDGFTPKLSADEWGQIYSYCCDYDISNANPRIQSSVIYLHALSALTLRKVQEGLSCLKDLKKYDERACHHESGYLICNKTGKPQSFHGIISEESSMKGYYHFLKNIRADDDEDSFDSNIEEEFFYNGKRLVRFISPKSLNLIPKDCKPGMSASFWIKVAPSGLTAVKREE